jgi:hypothetical protein
MDERRYEIQMERDITVRDGWILRADVFRPGWQEAPGNQ